MAQPVEVLKKQLELDKDKMFRIAWKMCGNREDAEEVLQETAVKALGKWHQFRGDAQVSTWLFRIASNACLEKQRAKPMTTIDPSDFDGLARNTANQELPEVHDWSQDPLTQTLNDELKTVLDRAIMKLPDTYRLVFLLRDVEGFSIEDTANALAMTKVNVKVRLHRARMFLRDELASYITEHQEGNANESGT